MGVKSSFQIAVGHRHPHDVNYYIEDDRVRDYLRAVTDAGFEIGLHGSYRSTENPQWYVEEAHLLVFGVAGRHDDDRGATAAADLAADLLTRDVGEPEVEDDQVRRLGVGQRQGLGPRLGLEEAVGDGFERCDDRLSNRALVVNDQDAAGPRGGINSVSSISPTVFNSRCPCSMPVNLARLVLSQSCSRLLSVVSRRL